MTVSHRQKTNWREAHASVPRILILGAAVAGVAWLAGCGDGATDPAPPPPPPPDPPRPTTVSVTPSTGALTALGATAQLTAEVRDQNGQVMTGVALSWASASPAAAMVDASGLVTAVGNGTATITATAGSASGSAEVTVAQEVDAVTVAPAADTLVAGDTLRLAAEAADANGHAVAAAEFSWETSDASVATVDASGLVTAVAAGEVAVTASVSGVTGRAGLVVEAAAPSTVTLTPESVVLSALADTSRLTADVRDQLGQPVAGATVAWVTDDALVATVDSAGLVTAVGNGTATITATAGSASGSAEVTVAQEVDAVTVAPAADTLVAGDTLRLEAEAADANGHAVAGAEFSWETSDASVATVDASGLVTAVAEGTATVTAASGTAHGTAGITVADADREALFALYEATNGAGWIENEGWLSDRPVGEWHGVTTGEDGRVTGLRLSASNLAGPIPPALGSLTRLETLDFERNELSGAIPPELGGLANLKTLILGVNDLTGRIPPELGTLGNLETLRLRRNDLTGPIPPELSDLQNLQRLGLDRNQLTGSIPLGFLELDALRVLHFGDNDGLCVAGSADFLAWLADFEVSVGPRCNEKDRAVLTSLYEAAGGVDWTRSGGWLGDGALEQWHGLDTDPLGRVTGIDLAGNGLAGRVPGSLAQLPALTSVRVDGNAALTGPLPLSLSALSLRELRYEDTGLCIPPDQSFQEWLGAIPSHEGTGAECSALADREILALLYEATGGPGWIINDNWLSDRPLGEWTGVTTDDDGRVTGLSLRGYNLAGLIPPELGSLSNLRTLELDANGLTGPIPAALGNLSGLSTLTVGSNDLTGSIPAELGSLSNLTMLDLGSNDLAGPIPVELGSLSDLTTLSLGSNDLTGPIPAELGGLANLTTLGLRSNDLTGAIPAELGNLSSLTSLDLRFNDLTGPIPPELVNLPHLTTLSLNSNDLTGPIPPELGSLSSLRALALYNNSLSGPIPPELGGLSNLGTLSLYNNDLTGPIPPELGDLSNLVGLYLQDNHLTGPIPPELGMLSSLLWLYLLGNQLTGSVPSELGDLTQLRRLYLSSNAEMSGALPESLAGLTRLEELLLTGTGLCAPAAAGFQDWLANVRLALVRRCEMEGGSRAYLTQAVQSLAFPVPLVAGEAALLRVFVTASSETSEGIPPVKATFYLDGVETHVADIAGSATPIPTDLDAAESTLDMSANAEIPGSVIQPGLEMTIEIDPDDTLDSGLGVTKRIPESGRTAVRVEAMPALDLTVVPFLWAEGSDRSIVDIAEGMAADPQGHEMLWDTRTLLPVHEFDVKAHESILTSTTNVFTLVREVRLAWTVEGRRGRYVGIMPEYVIGGESGLASGPVAFAVANSFVIGHELGHVLSLRHAPCGGAGGPDAAFPQGDGSIGAWGYDFRDGGALVPPYARDIMSYCGPPRWMSDYGFTKALNYRLRTEVGAAAVAQASAEAPTRALILWGGVDAQGEPFLEPAFVLDAPAAVPRSPGEYEVVGRAGTGGELFSLSFEMPETADGDGGSSFVIALPAQTEWAGVLASITLSGPGGSTMMDLETDQPMAILRDLASGQVLGILRDPSPAEMARAGVAATPVPGSDLEIVVSRGIPAVTEWRRD